MRWLCLLMLLSLGCEHGKGGALDGTCAELSLLDCRNTPGCEPDICAGCFCDQAFRGCLPAGVVPTPCPALGCPSAECCSSGVECTQGASCVPPEGSQSCGACNPQVGDCLDDNGCATGTICEPIQCSCNSESACVPGCESSLDCTAAGTVCDTTTGRCVAAPCRDDAACPSNFGCNGSTCSRTACASDLDCDGFCVTGFCFAALGECQLRVP